MNINIVINMSKVPERLKIIWDGNSFVALKKENPYWRAFIASGYGEEKGDIIEFDLVEVLHLTEKKKASIRGRKGEVLDKKTLFSLANGRKDFWSKYLIYKDLRLKGYTVKLAREKPLVVHIYNRGVNDVRVEKPVFSVLPAEAAKELKIVDLDRAIEICKDLGTELIIGIIDELGEVVYYNVLEEILKLERDNEEKTN